jgi:hypothetical protein
MAGEIASRTHALSRRQENEEDRLYTLHPALMRDNDAGFSEQRALRRAQWWRPSHPPRCDVGCDAPPRRTLTSARKRRSRTCVCVRTRKDASACARPTRVRAPSADQWACDAMRLCVDATTRLLSGGIACCGPMLLRNPRKSTHRNATPPCVQCHGSGRCPREGLLRLPPRLLGVDAPTFGRCPSGSRATPW